MDLSNVELHLIAYLSSAEDSLRRAKAILSLAESNPENSKTLAACAIVLLAVALEQGVKTLLSEAAERISMETGEQAFETGPGRYLDIKVPSRIRVRSLPRVLTGSRFQLDPNHWITKTLEDLIETRNNLVHVDEPAKHLIGPADVKVENGQIKASFFVPLNPWATVEIEHAQRFEHAVDVYFTEVVFPKSGEITEGTIVISAR
jgi:hypothetical protein